MRTPLITAVALAALLAGGSYAAYRLYLPGAMADAFVSEPPAYLPKAVVAQLEQIKVPVNKGADDLIKSLEKENVPVDRVLELIDRASEEDVDKFVEEIQVSRINTSNQLFDIFKKHFDANFDVETLREPFVKHIDVSSARRGAAYFIRNKRTHDIEFETAKDVFKQVIVKKYEERQKTK